MAEEVDFDVVVVGAGVAGCVAGYTLANAGLNVLVVERGTEPGDKEMTGGRIYTHSLAAAMPDLVEKAPLDRRVTRERLSFGTAGGAVSVDYIEPREADFNADSYTVLSGSFTRWLGEQAESAGATMASGIRVDEILKRDGRVCGIVSGDESISCTYVILADGVNSLLAEQAGIARFSDPHHMAVGAKEVIELGEDVINQRFGVSSDEGVAWLFAGDPTEGAFGGGLLYTNKDTVSLGIIRTLSDIDRGEMSLPRQLEEFKRHPVIAPLIKDGKMIEYSGHMVPEPGMDFVPQRENLVVPGLLAVGDCAGLILNTGFMVRGLDLAVASGQYAGQAIVDAHAADAADAEDRYVDAVHGSFIFKEMDNYKKFPLIMTNHRIYNEYPQLLNGIMGDLFTVRGGAEPVSLWSRIRVRIAAGGGMRAFMKDFRSIHKAIK